MADLLELTFKTLDGGSFSLHLPADMEVGAVAELVAEELIAQRDRQVAEGSSSGTANSEFEASSSPLTPERIRFIFKGQALQHNRSLESYGVQSGQPLHIVVRPAPPVESSQQQRRHDSADSAPNPNLRESQSQAPPLRFHWSPISLAAGNGTLLLGGVQLGPNGEVLSSVPASTEGDGEARMAGSSSDSNNNNNNNNNNSNHNNSGSRLVERLVGVAVQMMQRARNVGGASGSESSPASVSTAGAPSASTTIPRQVPVTVSNSVVADFRREDDPAGSVLPRGGTEAMALPWDVLSRMQELSPERLSRVAAAMADFAQLNAALAELLPRALSPTFEGGDFQNQPQQLQQPHQSEQPQQQGQAQEERREEQQQAVSVTLPELPVESEDLASAGFESSEDKGRAQKRRLTAPSEGDESCDGWSDASFCSSSGEASGRQGRSVRTVAMAERVASVLQDSNEAQQQPHQMSDSLVAALSELPQRERDLFRVWTENPQVFSRSVLKAAKPIPFSNAYQLPPSSVAAEQALALTWRSAANAAGVGGECPSELQNEYLTLQLRDVAEAADHNEDFAFLKERFPSLSAAVDVLRAARGNQN